ncbi:MAG: hypothetical protein NT103_00410 [Campylobacterales bacterium]|nr:hypothetical protein [Campylobacterales bacterium]
MNLSRYAGDNIVAIYDNDTDELLATLLHEEDAIDSPLSIHLHPNEPLTMEESETYEHMDETEQFLFNQSRIKRYYYHRDHQNSIIALSDDNAQIVEYYEYDIYGTITKAEHTNGIQTLNPYRYTGREYDTDDLYYYRARYYDPTIGRFIIPDPIGFLSGDTNFYRYVENDPVNFTDPSGLSGLLALLDEHNPIKDAIEWWNTAPDTSIPKTAVPNSTMPKGKTVTQASKPKAAQSSSKTAQTNKGDGVKISGNMPKVVDEKCKDQTWYDPIDNPQLANYTKGGGKAPYWNVFGTVRKGKMHAGVDLLAKPGTNVYACVDGIIDSTDIMRPRPPKKVSYGKYILLRAKCPSFVRGLKKPYSMPYTKEGEMEKEAGFDEKTDAPIYFFYAHLLEIDPVLKKAFDNGERVEVKAGQVVGTTGTSGYDTSADPHLHFEIRSAASLARGVINRINPGFYMKYKLPDELTQSESSNQKEIAKKQQGDPSIER